MSTKTYYFAKSARFCALTKKTRVRPIPIPVINSGVTQTNDFDVSRLTQPNNDTTINHAGAVKRKGKGLTRNRKVAKKVDPPTEEQRNFR
jgi:hypothetical protein